MIRNHYYDKLSNIVLENHRVRTLAITYIKEFLLTMDNNHIYFNDDMRSETKVIKKLFIDKYDGDKVKAEILYLDNEKDKFIPSTINLSVLETNELINIYGAMGEMTFGKE